MCEPATAMLALTALTTAVSTRATLMQDAPKAPKVPKPVVEPPPTPKPKPSVGGFGSTLLTGARGLAPGSQNIGTSTLLGQ